MMIEKTEWEVVDETSTNGRRHTQYTQYTQQSFQDAGAGADAWQEPPFTPKAATEAVLGKWWKWKLAGVAILALVVFAFFATVVGITAVALLALALLAAGVRKVKQWLGGSGTNVMRM